MNLGQRICESRQNLKITQKELALAVGVSVQHISAIELNKRNVSLNLLVALADELGTTTDYILTGKQGLSSITTAIKADKHLDLKVKKALVVILEQINRDND